MKRHSPKVTIEVRTVMIGSDVARGEHVSRAESPYLVEIHVNIIILVSHIQGNRSRKRERDGQICIQHPATVHDITSARLYNTSILP